MACLSREKNLNEVVEITDRVAKTPYKQETDIRLRKSHPGKHPLKIPVR